jgi:peroxisomal membrane protein 4
MDNVKALQEQFEKVILDPKYHDPLVLVKAIRNGLVYGTKIRFPHALVMVFLFRPGTLQEKIKLVWKATRQHALNLATFALLYKSSMMVLKNLNGGKEASVHTFLAGLLGGYWVFGHGKAGQRSVTQQIVIYVFARVVLAVAKLAVTPPGDNSLVGGSYGGHGGKGLLGLNERQLELVRKNAWPVFASLSWASVMWLFRWYPETLQPSLRSSMSYMYVHFSLVLFVLLLLKFGYPASKNCFSTDLAADEHLSLLRRYSNADQWSDARTFLWHNK